MEQNVSRVGDRGDIARGLTGIGLIVNFVRQCYEAVKRVACILEKI